MKYYSYVGPSNISYSKNSYIERNCIANSLDVLKWIKETDQQLDTSLSVIATYIIDTNKQLWVADRGFEHVVCAHGKEILAAGEMTFIVENNSVVVSYVSNQSTGYCPKKNSWIVVKEILEKACIPHPDSLSLAITFRRCDSCKQINIVKDNIFECDVCDKSLNLKWNF